jgi:hypothetical protein
MSKEDIYENPDIKHMLRDFQKHVLPAINDSVVTLSLISKRHPDPKMCLEMGAALLLDKPIIAICIDRAEVSQHLLKIAAAVVEVDDLTSEASHKKIQEAITRVVEGVAE